MEGWHRTPAHPRSRPPQALAQALMPRWSFSDPQDTGGRGASPTDGVRGGMSSTSRPRTSLTWRARQGPQSGWDWGSSGSSGATVPWGEALILPAPRPAPPHAAACAELSSRLPGPAEACCPPRPGASLTSQGQEPVLPGMPGSSQRTLFPRGSGSPRILSILLLGRRAGPLPAPIFVSISHRAHIAPSTDSLCHSL